MLVLIAHTLVKQHDITDCGAACLASVVAHYKLRLPIARIRQMAGTNQKGTNMLGLIEAAQKIGFQAKGVRGNIESLAKIPFPAIAHVVLEGGLHHYVVLYRIKDKKATYKDPGNGKLHTKSIDEFKQLWTGILMIMMPSGEFKVISGLRSCAVSGLLSIRTKVSWCRRYLVQLWQPYLACQPLYIFRK